MRTHPLSGAVVMAIAVFSIGYGLRAGGAGAARQDTGVLLVRGGAVSPLQGRPPPRVKPAAGTFLVASRQLGDPHFAHTVVLVLQYDSQGAMGLIINRPTETPLATVFPEIEGLQPRPDTVYVGGPVARKQILLLLQTRRQLEGTHLVWGDVYVSGSRSVLRQVVDEAVAEERFRAYSGYAGWAPGQLDHEIARGDWHVLHADAATVFEMPASEIWPRLLRQGEGPWL